MNSLRAKLGICHNVKQIKSLGSSKWNSTEKTHPLHTLYSVMGTKFRNRFISKFTKRFSSSVCFWRRHPVFMRDACACSRCIDPHSGQKNFKTSEIPLDIQVRSTKIIEGGLEVEWKNDIPRFQSHKSIIPTQYLYPWLDNESHLRRDLHPTTWESKIIEYMMPSLRFDYNDYINDDKIMRQLIRELTKWGLVFLNGVPNNEEAVENIANRIGPIRHTFYGKTWDVISVNQAKNVAYTDKYLELHQDLLYMENPPGIQILHCLKNTCEGGESLFCDAFRVATQLSVTDYGVLSKMRINYHYQKAGEYYKRSHLVLEPNPNDDTDPNKPRIPLTVNYSPPFQAPFPLVSYNFPPQVFVQSLKKFTQIAESTQNVFKCRLQPENCVIFNNRRILHGREAFESQSGERWLKGCYLDSDVFLSRSRVVHEL